MIWEPATVAETTAVNDELFQLSLAVTASVADGFHVAGQYHRVLVDGVGDATFAIASAPGQRAFDYLVKRHGHLTQALSRLSAGASVRVSHVGGKGFPLELAKGHDLLLVGTGSGVGPLRSVIEVVRRRRQDFGKVTLVYGVRTSSHLAWASSFEGWATEDIRVVPTVTRPDASWTGATGRVQQHLGGTLGQSIAFLCGQKQMVHEVTSLLAARGLPTDRIFLNH